MAVSGDVNGPVKLGRGVCVCVCVFCLVPLSFIYSCRLPKLFGQSCEMDFGRGVGRER